MGPPPDPEHMASMLENPNFQSQLSEALSNPDIIDQMIRTNPMLQRMGPQVRQMMQDPSFRRMMTDPESLRQINQMQRQFGGAGGPFGGMPGMGGGEGAFPAPGVTDTMPEGADGQRNANAQQTDSTSQQQPPNPFATFPGAGPGAGPNPFAALFGQGPMGAMGGGGGTQPSGGAPADGSTPNPQQQQQQGANPIAAMAQNMMQNPQMMQQMLSAFGGGSTPAANANGNVMAALQAMNGAEGLAGAGFGSAFPPPAAAPQDDRPPEDRYAEQLRQLNDMGFFEFERNVEALRRTGGNVVGAVEYLLTH